MSTRIRTSLLVTAGALAATSVNAQTLISDDFEANSSGNYTVIDDGTPDGVVTFAFDYLAAGIPLAPRSTGGTSKGLKITANDTAGVVDAFTVFHNTDVSVSHYILRVDVFMNYVVSNTTTEHTHVGVAGNGTTFNQLFSPISGSGAFIAFTGDGGSGSDYRWFRDPLNSPAGDGNTTLPNTHPSYLGNGSNGTGAFFQGGSSPSPPSTVAGSPGNIWTTVEIEVDNVAQLISFRFDGTLTFQGSFINIFDGLVSLGLADVFTSVSDSTVFTVFDNLEVVEVAGGTIGTNYCTANANSTGNTALMSAIGSAVVSANNLTLQASSMPNNAFGFFLTSTSQGFIQNPGGSQGNLCLSGAIGRYVGPGQIKNSGATGSFSLVADLTLTPQPTGLTAIQAGQTWNFTAWYRDAVGGTATSNFTNGLQIMFM